LEATSKKNILQEPQLVCGTFSKKEAAKLIVAGTRHLHSCPLGDRDPGSKVTQQFLQGGKLPAYPWETANIVSEIPLLTSVDRTALFTKIVTDAGMANKRELSERILSVLEELSTNALYHSYKKADGSEKYQRRQVASLNDQEKISIRHAHDRTGLYVSIADQGGSLTFADIVSSFSRCYSDKKVEIQTKEGGAGLGMYMIFEYVTHLKIETYPGKKTVISCWISDKKSNDPKVFSFNFFEWREPNGRK